MVRVSLTRRALQVLVMTQELRTVTMKRRFPLTLTVLRLLALVLLAVTLQFPLTLLTVLMALQQTIPTPTRPCGAGADSC